MNLRRVEKIKRVISSRQRDLIVVLEDVHDPHNAAAVLRTAEAFGVPAVYFIFEQEKYYNPKRVGKSSSASANKWLEFKVFRSTEQCLYALKKLGYTIFATTVASGADSIFKCRFRGKVALLFGNEHRGLSQQALSYSDRQLTIPMRGMVQSLNLSVTAAICIYELTRQRQASGKKFTLSARAQKQLRTILIGSGSQR
jgi:tRNA (guanosine-2'-O-)-methyltransferase